MSLIRWNLGVLLLTLTFAFGLDSIPISAIVIGSTNVAQTASDGVRRVTPEEVRESLKKEEAILIDVRSEASYKAGHIKGARSIPLGEIGSHVKELPRNKLIITYCS